MMEDSKSTGNKTNETKLQNIVDGQTVVDILENDIEREIQSVFITSDQDHNEPCCSKSKPREAINKELGTTLVERSIMPSLLPYSAVESMHQEVANLETIRGEVLEVHESQKNDRTLEPPRPVPGYPCPVPEPSRPVPEPSCPVPESPRPVPRPPHPLPEPSRPVLESPRHALERHFELPSTSFIIPPELFSDIHSIDNPPRVSSPDNHPRVHQRPTRISPAFSYRETPPASGRGIPTINFPDDHIIHTLQRREPPINGPPPSYSKSLLDRRVNPCASIQFVAPIPPPSYDGLESELRYTGHAGFTLGLGNTWQSQPQPAYCPVCETVIITQVDIRISRISHIMATILFLILCWPCCLMPYFLNICNFTYHYCSVCRCYLGARRPFQRT